MYQQDRRFTYVIANVPYSRVDHYYSTTEDLLQVFEVLDEYCRITNEDLENYYDSRNGIKDILLIVDEAHLYLGARESLTKASILNKLKLIFTQCRKRKIRIVFITQRLTQIDIYVRRLSDYVEEYNLRNVFGLELDKKSVYLNKGDVVDIETDQSVKFTNDGQAQTIKEETLIHSEYFSPLTSFLELFALADKGYRQIIKEEHQTYHVCGSEDPRVKEFTFPLLMRDLIITPTKKELEKRKRKRENKNKKWYERYIPGVVKFRRQIRLPIKQKIMSVFHPGFEALDFNELYKEEERLEKADKLNADHKQKTLEYHTQKLDRIRTPGDDLLNFIKKQDDICKYYKNLSEKPLGNDSIGNPTIYSPKSEIEKNMTTLQKSDEVKQNKKVLILG